AFNAGGQYSFWSASRTFRNVMLTPAILTPVDGSEIPSLRPLFDWSDIVGATSYTLQVATNNSFTLLAVNVTLPTSSLTPTSNLPKLKVLHVRVRANGPNGPSPWSPVISFIIIP
ncbi:MAG TPA: hypothetical protein VLD63_08275, partial [Anaerolineales bacterium]|nr:hypothetical protein [Anaerolineales bacterium]